MTTQAHSDSTPREPSRLRMDQPATYTIRVQGWLGERWMTLLDTAELHTEANRRYGKVTTIVNRMVDQAALHGLLRSLYGMGMPVMMVRWDEYLTEDFDLDDEGEHRA